LLAEEIKTEFELQMETLVAPIDYLEYEHFVEVCACVHVHVYVHVCFRVCVCFCARVYVYVCA